MPPLRRRLTHRQEQFCRAFVAYPCKSNAARIAGYSGRHAPNAGYRLLLLPRIRARIAEIQAEMAETACRETDILLGKLEVVYRRAMVNGRDHAAVRAVEMQARLLAGVAAGRAVIPEGEGQVPEKSGTKHENDEF